MEISVTQASNGCIQSVWSKLRDEPELRCWPGVVLDLKHSPVHS